MASFLVFGFTGNNLKMKYSEILNWLLLSSKLFQIHLQYLPRFTIFLLVKLLTLGRTPFALHWLDSMGIVHFVGSVRKTKHKQTVRSER